MTATKIALGNTTKAVKKDVLSKMLGTENMYINTGTNKKLIWEGFVLSLNADLKPIRCARLSYCGGTHEGFDSSNERLRGRTTSSIMDWICISI